MVSNGDQPHSVIEYFVGNVEGSWRDAMQAYVDGGELNQKLLHELMSYQLARIDDTWARGGEQRRDHVGQAKICRKCFVHRGVVANSADLGQLEEHAH